MKMVEHIYTTFDAIHEIITIVLFRLFDWVVCCYCCIVLKICMRIKQFNQQRELCACVSAMRNKRFACDVVLPHRRTSCKINELLTNFNNIIIIIQRNQTITNKFYIYTRLSTAVGMEQTEM